MATKLSPAQAELVRRATNLHDIVTRQKGHDHGLLVSGHKYRTACSLERKGLGSVRYQGPSLGWFTLTSKEA